MKASTTRSATSSWRSSASTPPSNRLLLPLAKLLDLNREELRQRLALLGRHLVERDRGAEDVLRPFLAAPHLHDRTDDLTRDVDAPVAREDQRARRPRLDRRAMHDRRAGETEVDELPVDVGKLNGDGCRRKAFRSASFAAAGH